MIFLKKCGHFALGAWAGWQAPVRPLFALISTIIFFGYQRLEQVRMKDEGFHEAFQFGAGFALGSVARWLWDALDTPSRSSEYERGRQDERRAVLLSAQLAEKKERLSWRCRNCDYTPVDYDPVNPQKCVGALDGVHMMEKEE